MFRSERSGVLTGLSRVRQINLDDAHVFCRPDQVRDEVRLALEAVLHVHEVLGTTIDHVRLSRRGDGAAYQGSDDSGPTPRRSCGRRSTTSTWPGAASPGPSSPARRRSTARSSTCRSPTPGATWRPCRPCSWTSASRSGSTSPTPGPTAGRSGSSWCTAGSWARWSGWWRSSSSCTAAASRSGWRPCRSASSLWRPTTARRPPGTSRARLRGGGTRVARRRRRVPRREDPVVPRRRDALIAVVGDRERDAGSATVTDPRAGRTAELPVSSSRRAGRRGHGAGAPSSCAWGSDGLAHRHPGADQAVGDAVDEGLPATPR